MHSRESSGWSVSNGVLGAWWLIRKYFPHLSETKEVSAPRQNGIWGQGARPGAGKQWKVGKQHGNLGKIVWFSSAHVSPEHYLHETEILSKVGTCCSFKDKKSGNIRDYKLSQAAPGNLCNKNYHNQSWKKQRSHNRISASVVSASK